MKDQNELGDAASGPGAASVPSRKNETGFAATTPPIATLTDEERDAMQQAEDDLNMDDIDEDEERGELIGYYCISCGNTQGNRGFGDQCNKCCGPLDEWYA